MDLGDLTVLQGLLERHGAVEIQRTIRKLTFPQTQRKRPGRHSGDPGRDYFLAAAVMIVMLSTYEKKGVVAACNWVAAKVSPRVRDKSVTAPVFRPVKVATIRGAYYRVKKKILFSPKIPTDFVRCVAALCKIKPHDIRWDCTWIVPPGVPIRPGFELVFRHHFPKGGFDRLGPDSAIAPPES
jgi:hypothetical protein